MRKRTLTLLEIMIVIFLITLITGAIGYNMRGALEKGKAFRTERAIEQLRELLLLRFAEVGSMPEVIDHLRESIESSGLAKDPQALMKDGWGEPFAITLSRNRADFTIRSKKLDDYNRTHNRRKADVQQNGIDEDDL